MLVVKVDRCLGCKSCELACAVEHSASRDLYEAIHETPGPRARVRVSQGTTFAIPLQCRQCGDAPCVAICPTNALHRADEESPVFILFECIIQLFLSIHNNWSIPCNRLFYRFPGYQKQPEMSVFSSSSYFIAITKQNKVLGPKKLLTPVKMTISV